MNTFEEIENRDPHIPLILKLDAAGQPVDWVHWETATTLTWNNKVRWTLGTPIELRGGMRGDERSKFELAPIIACEDQSMARRRAAPSLTNRTLFRRDNHLCMYCGNEFASHSLTRDHVIPTSKGGKNTWNNCVAACRRCNQRKDDKTPEQAGMKLLAIPYTPNPAEYLILKNRRIIADQMEFLSKMIPENSRAWKYIQ